MSAGAGTPVALEELTPRQIVAELDRHVVGQAAAKRAVAIALRNRWRRQRLPPEVAEEILPKNILMIGPTGVGKTEIARRLAKLARAPFVKVEASKFTEVGYVGRDCEAMVRDLMEMAVAMVREERRVAVRPKAAARAEERLLALLLPPTPAPGAVTTSAPVAEEPSATREKLRERLRSGSLDDRPVEIEVDDRSGPSLEMIGPQGIEEVGINLKEMIPGFFGRKSRIRVTVAEARELLEQEEADALIDRQQVARDARHRVEQAGIIFLDEIDKIAGRERGHGPDVSREGVQRDLLPIVEGTTVATKHGPVRTDHILFIAAGAFHIAKPSDLIPELQGRFPIRVELEALGEAEFLRILVEPEASLTRQYTALLSTEGVTLRFTDGAIAALARLAVEVNAATENIGARRLATLLERLLEEISFAAPDMAGVELEIDEGYVSRALAGIAENQDLSRYVL
ncbi:MAG TPA: ATP-dependent protease ATPase subunit HslU [Thermoanaerobaculia bacterium]|nr:ATP-dependent protease ATPase subunit HslU [Acidobacteriota bacterium]HPA96503.1 ATP-dependent protease ATPase subunit HslU [Thermoanaerobaculia bacterium]HRR14743.1 ATP-dependent protease ATPase subunit HslU [Thermoanaerobaculia bacterium]HRS37270.1 ATP-dependent protease ATPase subunit HslU [Thermoanaerobaculia bacterium]HRU09702.1 ATP-dependent protease ATPase subunit HslU [Thermoanaerobaculia bacterium]